MYSDDAGPRLGEAVTFYAPLALNNLMMMLSHTLLATGLARSAEPIVALAAFALARSVVHIIENPLFTVRQLTVVFSTTAQGSARTMRFVLGTAAAISALLAIVSGGSWGSSLIMRLFAVDAEVAWEVVRSLRAFLPLPLFIGLRSFHQGLLIRSRRTVSLPVGTLIRLGLVCGWILIVPYFPYWGAAGGAAALTAAIGVEMLFVMACSRRLPVTCPATGSVVEEDTRYRALIMFAVPLALMTLLHCLTNPLINYGLGRLPRGVTWMAAFAVGDSLAKLLLSPVESLHQLVMVFVRGPKSAGRLHTMVIGFGALVTAVMAVSSWGPIGFIISHFMGLTGEAAEAAVRVYRVMSALPLIVSIRQYYWGVLYRRRATAAIGVGKAANVAAIVLLLGACVRLLPTMGAAVGAVALVAGEVAEALAIAKLELVDRRTRLGLVGASGQ